MGLGSGSGGCSSSCGGGSGSAGSGVRHEPLKRCGMPRRGLSAFYVTKSQSFSCMDDLVCHTAFSSSSCLLLAKRACSTPPDVSTVTSGPGWLWPPRSARDVDTISEEPSHVALEGAELGPRRRSLERRSWDGACQVTTAPLPGGAAAGAAGFSMCAPYLNLRSAAADATSEGLCETLRMVQLAPATAQMITPRIANCAAGGAPLLVPAMQ